MKKGAAMSQWQEQFSRKVGALVDRATRTFDVFADEVVVAAFTDIVEFTNRFEFKASTPQHTKGFRSFKFSLAEDAYVLISFRTKGVAGVECEYECFVSGMGKSESLRTQVSLCAADRGWVDTCFRAGLDFFVDQYARHGSSHEVGELAAV